MAAGASPQQPTPEARRAFERLTNAVRVVDAAIDAFDLSEASVKNIWNALYALEKLYQRETNASVGPRGSAVRDALEVEYAASVGVSDPREVTVSASLDKWSKKGLDLLSGDSTKEVSKKLESLGVLVASSDLVFVETDSAPLTRGDGGGTWTKGRVEPRLQQLIAHLQLTGIHKDDLVVRVGTVRDDMMRSEPYVIVEIPALSKEVVVCNQVGEITFVSSQRMGPDFYASRTKEQLKGTLGIEAVTYRRQEQWLEDVTRLLFRDGEPRKVDVRDREALRNAVLSIEGMSPTTWMKMSQAESACLKVPGCGIGLVALARRFDVRGNPTAKRAFYLELGERIFGFGTVISDALRIERASPDELRTMIVDGGMTAESWVRMTQLERNRFRVPGTNIALGALATRFGVCGDPRALRDIHLQLGEKIFGPGTVISSERESKSLSLEGIRDALAKGGITAERWLGQNSADRQAFRVPGTDMGLKALSTQCGISENPYTKLGFLALGERIFGEGTAISDELQAARKSVENGAKDVEELKSLIKGSGLTERDWVRMGILEKRSFKVPGTDMGLQALATRLGVQGKALSGPVVFLELGERIFGNGAVISAALELARASDEMKEWSSERLTAAITSDGMTAEKWIEMGGNAKAAYTIPGSTIGLTALARRFSMTGDPVGRHDVHLELGVRIFGFGTVISDALRIERASPDELRTMIVDGGVTAESWVRMTQQERKIFRAPGTNIALRALATRFGVCGDPRASRDVHLQLGEKIFGPSTVISSERESKSLSLEGIREALAKGGITAEGWLAQDSAARLRFRLPGTDITLTALAGRLDVSENPFSKLGFLALGERIFGEGTAISVELQAARISVENGAKDVEELKSLIQESGMTVTEWVRMRTPQKESFRVPGTDMGLQALATRLGVKGNPLGGAVVFLEMGERIFGEEPVIVEALRLARNTERVRALPLDEIRDIITSAGYSAITWAAMRKPDRLAFKVPTSNIGIKALARIFGVEGNPSNQNEAHRLLGQKLFGTTL